jgi:site-specific DNA-methyltransferase (adenine-specific)
MQQMIKDNIKIDLIVTDPPYEVGKKHKSKNADDLSKSMYKISDDLNNLDIINGFNYDKILNMFLKLQDKVNIYIWCNKNQIPIYLDFFVNKRNCKFEILKWCKINPPPLFGNGYLKDTEYCLYFKNTGVKCKPDNRNDAFTHYISNTNTKDRNTYSHPTIKPLGFIERMIKNSSNENDLIFDPFMGTGTTGVASKYLNRNFIGCEISDKYFKIAEQRLNEYMF